VLANLEDAELNWQHHPAQPTYISRFIGSDPLALGEVTLTSPSVSVIGSGKMQFTSDSTAAYALLEIQGGAVDISEFEYLVFDAESSLEGSVGCTPNIGIVIMDSFGYNEWIPNVSDLGVTLPCKSIPEYTLAHGNFLLGGSIDQFTGEINNDQINYWQGLISTTLQRTVRIPLSEIDYPYLNKSEINRFYFVLNPQAGQETTIQIDNVRLE
jgi:hypothetical protein